MERQSKRWGGGIGFSEHLNYYEQQRSNSYQRQEYCRLHFSTVSSSTLLHTLCHFHHQGLVLFFSKKRNQMEGPPFCLLLNKQSAHTEKRSEESVCSVSWEGDSTDAPSNFVSLCCDQVTYRCPRILMGRFCSLVYEFKSVSCVPFKTYRLLEGKGLLF